MREFFRAVFRGLAHGRNGEGTDSCGSTVPPFYHRPDCHPARGPFTSPVLGSSPISASVQLLFSQAGWAVTYLVNGKMIPVHPLHEQGNGRRPRPPVTRQCPVGIISSMVHRPYDLTKFLQDPQWVSCAADDGIAKPLATLADAEDPH